MNLKFKHIILSHLEKRNLSIFLFILLVFLFQGCEKDDICSEETQKTPLVKISFQDGQDNEKTVPFLQVGFEGAKIVDDDNDDETPTVPIRLPTQAATVSEILLPLDTQNNSTTFYFIRNSGQVDDDGMSSIENIDTVKVIYTRVYDYVSRACGYKITFKALSDSKEEFEDKEDRWIESVFVEKSTVENSEETHIIIRH